MSLWQLPAVLLVFLTWLQSQPVSLADAAAREALRRQLTPKSVRSLTNDDVEGLPRRPLPVVAVPDADALARPAAAAGGVDSAKPGTDTRDEAWWRTRLTASRAALDRNQLLADALQSSINALTTEWSARDDPAERQQIFERRARALGELGRITEQIEAGKKAVGDLEEAARRENVPAGWIR